MNDDDKNARGRKRLRGFVIHLAVYFAVSIALVLVNHMTDPARPWFLWPVVGWGSILAIHVAFVMGLFDIFKHDDQ
jgi:putative flippase GtrA